MTHTPDEQFFLIRFRIVGFILASILTALLGWQASGLKVDASFTKLLPQHHPFMATLMDHRENFGGANRVLVALSVTQGDIFEPQFMDTLKKATDDVFFIPGVIRGQVQSLFTPNVRYIEVVKDGFDGGNVIPADFKPTPEGLSQVKENILKAGVLGRLVSTDFTSALISANLQEIDPTTGQQLAYTQVAQSLEQIREKYENEHIRVHIIGFAKAIGDITDGARQVVIFFAIAACLILVLLRLYSGHMILTLLPMLCSLCAVIWQLGLLVILGYGIDPMSMLIPFLIFAIGISHSVQVVNSFRQSIAHGQTQQQAAVAVFRRLLKPGCFALVSDTVGFLTIYFIDIPIIKEMAITASIGVALIIITNLFLLPMLLSTITIKESTQDKTQTKPLSVFWKLLSHCVSKPVARTIILVCCVLLVGGLWQGQALQIGDLHEGVPELWPDSRYNLDTAFITDRFAIGVDIFTIIAETVKDGCVHPSVMRKIDHFDWAMQNISGVNATLALPAVVKKIYMGYNEGYPKWFVLPEHSASYAQSLTFIDTSTGLLNRDCDAMPIYVFTQDHKAGTINNVAQAAQLVAKDYSVPESLCEDNLPCPAETDLHQMSEPKVNFRLAAGNVGVMAATNDTVAASQIPILLYVYVAVTLLCWLSFRSLKGVICVIAPLALVSILANALMALLPVGLKISTLPVVALGVGIGVDYGIYIYTNMSAYLKQGFSLKEAYTQSLQETGTAVLFTGLTLTIAVSTWRFSALKFQADMGVLLGFMFFLNMLGALLVLPALTGLMTRSDSKQTQ